MAIVRNAMGKKDGDYLTLANKWATVTITYQPEFDPEKPYLVEGDIRPKRFDRVKAAYEHAFMLLEYYETGRAD